MNRLAVTLSTCAALLCGACLPLGKNIPGLKKLSAPKSGPITLAFQRDYCTDSERRTVRQGTPLAVLLWDDKCGAGMTTCATGLDAAKGTLPAPYEKLFRDLLHASTEESGGPNFVYDTCNVTSRVKPYVLGIDGLGLSHAEKHQAALADFARQYGHLNFNDSSTQRRLVRALFLTGKSETAVDALRSLLDEKPEADGYKPEVLKYLATWDSSAAVDYCVDVLREGKGPKEACIWYLGENRHREAYELILRRMEDEEEAAVRALGHLGDPRAVSVLEKVLQAKPGMSVRTATLVALMNLGRDELFPEFDRLLRGRTLLSSGAETSRVNVGLVEAATLEVLDLEDAGLREKSFQVVQSLVDLTEESSQSWRVPVVLSAARASLGDPEAVKALVTLLDDPKKDVRHLVVRFVGANFDQLRGLRVVDRSVVDALARAYEMEPRGGSKHAIVLAVAYIDAA